MKNIMREINTQNIVIVDTEATANISTEYDREKRETTHTVTPLVARIHNELLKRFIDAKFQPIVIRIQGEDVEIEPFSEEPYGIPTLRDIGFFGVKNAPRKWEGDSLIMLSAKIANYNDEIEADRKGKASLKEMFEKKLKGRDQEELRLGNDLNIEVWSGRTIAEACENHGVSVETGERAMRLSSDFESYSDTYKSYYGVRPSFVSGC